MQDQFPALLVVLPLVAAPLIVIVRRPALAWGIATAVSWAALYMSIHLLRRTLAGETIIYEMGEWPPPLGIAYRVTSSMASTTFISAITRRRR